MGCEYEKIPDGLGLSDCRAIGLTESLRHGEVYSLSPSERFGFPSGLSQKSPSGPAAVVSVDISSEGEEALFMGSVTLADQKLVWFNDIPSGRSIMKRPS